MFIDSDPRLIVHFSDGLAPFSVRNGGYPLYSPSSVAVDVTLKDVLKDPEGFCGIEFSEWFEVHGTMKELWGTVMHYNAAQSNDLKTFDINWSDNHKLYYKGINLSIWTLVALLLTSPPTLPPTRSFTRVPTLFPPSPSQSPLPLTPLPSPKAPDLVVRLNRNRANEREGKNGYKLEVSASGRSVRARALTVNPNLESPSPAKQQPQRKQQRQPVPSRPQVPISKHTHIKTETNGPVKLEGVDTEVKTQSGKRKIPLSTKVGVSTNNGSTSDGPKLKKMKMSMGGGAGDGGVKTTATASKKKATSATVRGHPSKGKKIKSLSKGDEEVDSKAAAVTISPKLLTKSPNKMAGRGGGGGRGGGRGRKLPPPVSPKSIPVSFMTYMATTTAVSSSSSSAAAAATTTSTCTSLSRATSGDGSDARASALAPLHEISGYYQRGGVRYVIEYDI